MPVMESDMVLLESPAVLAQLLLEWTKAVSRGNGRRRGDLQPPRFKPGIEASQRLNEEAQPKRRGRAGVCSCGACVRCLDNAHWNSVYDEKFSDPSYYGGLSVRHNSSLAGA